jgi:hypothetical protein
MSKEETAKRRAGSASKGEANLLHGPSVVFQQASSE